MPTPQIAGTLDVVAFHTTELHHLSVSHGDGLVEGFVRVGGGVGEKFDFGEFEDAVFGERDEARYCNKVDKSTATKSCRGVFTNRTGGFGGSPPPSDALRRLVFRHVQSISLPASHLDDGSRAERHIRVPSVFHNLHVDVRLAGEGVARPPKLVFRFLHLLLLLLLFFVILILLVVPPEAQLRVGTLVRSPESSTAAATFQGALQSL